MSNELPPLPVTNVVVDGLWEEVYGPYTADQMHAYARAAVEADRLRMQETIERFPYWIGPHAKRDLLAALLPPSTPHG